MGYLGRDVGHAQNLARRLGRRAVGDRRGEHRDEERVQRVAFVVARRRRRGGAQRGAEVCDLALELAAQAGGLGAVELPQLLRLDRHLRRPADPGGGRAPPAAAGGNRAALDGALGVGGALLGEVLLDDGEDGCLLYTSPSPRDRG